MIRAVLVEDEPLIRAGLREALTSLGRIGIVAESSHGGEALAEVKKHAPDLVITDIRMAGGDGLTLIEHLRDWHPDVKVVVISGYSDFSYAQKALRFGVLDYLLKPVSRMDLARVVEQLSPTAHDREDAGSPAASTHPAISRIESYVREHLDADLRLGAIARMVRLNPQYLSVLFKQNVGQNYRDFVTECRIARACRLLERTPLHTYEIAALVGYQSPGHFMTVFKNTLGMTTTDWRGRKGVDPSLQ